MSDLNEMLNRAERRYAADGIADLVMGGLWLFWGAILLAYMLPEPWRLRGAGQWLGTAAMVAAAFAAQWLIRGLKLSFSAKRTGYIEPRRPGFAGNAAAAVLGLAFAALVALALTRSGLQAGMLLAPAFTLLLAFLFAIGRARWSATPGIYYALTCCLLAAASLALRLDAETGFAVLFLGLGAAAAAAGVWRLLDYLRTHPEAPNV
jgi:hypothetical protein